MSTTDKGVALITGASTGMGAVYADRLARRGYDLILVARNGDKLKSLADRILETSGRRVEILTADLHRLDDVEDIAERLGTDPAITMLINNAGVGSSTPLLETDADAMAEMIALNVEALMRLTYAAAPTFIAHGGGTKQR